MYTYQAEVIKVYDGDTITVNFDLGLFCHLQKQTIRLYGINAPEVRGDQRESGLVSKLALSNRILGKTITIKTYKDKRGKFGRWLGTLWDDPEAGSINDWMVLSGYAEYKEY